MRTILTLLLILPFAVFGQSLDKNFVKTTAYKAKSDGTYTSMNQTFDMSTNDAQSFFTSTGQGTIQIDIINDILTVSFNVIFPSGATINTMSQTPYINSSTPIPYQFLGYLDCGPNYPDLFKVSIGGSCNCIYIEENYSAPGATSTYFNETFTVSLEDPNNPSYTDDQKTEQITYFDGIGRPIQNILVKQSPTKKNMVVHNEYDNYSRVKKDFLPFTSIQNNQNYLTTAATDQFDFYSENQQYNDDYAYSDKVFDASPLNRVMKQGGAGQVWQPNPSVANTTDHVVRYDYKINSTTELSPIKLFKANSIWDPTKQLYLSTLVNNSGTVTYDTPVLTKIIVKNENWKQTDGFNNTTEEFTNKQGQVVLKRNYDNGVLDTYYVYDQYGSLSFVIPPKADSNIGTELDDLCYQYRYDYRNRLVEKKIPGKGWEYIIYDKLDRPILTQDSKLKLQGKWMFTKYDAFGRIVYTGEYTDNRNREIIQEELIAVATPVLYETKGGSAILIGGTTAYYSNNAFPNLNINLFTINYYDGYVFDLAGITIPSAIYGVPLTSKTKTLRTGMKIRTLETNEWTTVVTGYDDKARVIWSRMVNPTLSTNDITETKLDFIGKVLETKSTHTKTGSISNLITYDFFEYDHGDRLLKHTQKVGNNATQLITFNKYDELGALMEKKTGNGWTLFTATGVSKTNGTYAKTAATNNWTNGKIYSNSEVINNGNLSFITTASSNNIRIGLTATSSPQSVAYNQIQFALEFQNTAHVAGGKQVKVYQGNIDLGVKTNYIDGDEFTIEKIGTNMYFKKNNIEFYSISSATASTYKPIAYFYVIATTLSDITLNNYSYDNVVALEKTRYDFNIRNWLTGINKPTLTVPTPTELFSLEIHYNNPNAGAAVLYNGNISQTSWRTKTNNNWKNYSYSYDGLNRLKEALFKNTSNALENTNFFEKLFYDKNGNITNLYRSGDVVAQPNLESMDSMTYNYNGNQLKSIKEEGQGSAGFTTPIPATNPSDQYTYDVNGNITKDLNKGIVNGGADGITYNHLNLPTQIIFNSDAATKINYTYNALGMKLRKVVTSGTNTTTTEYGNGYSYSKVNTGTAKLDFIANPEGYSTLNNNAVNTLSYIFQYKDHLGNIRLSYSDSNKDNSIATSEIIEENHYYPLGMKHSGNVVNPGGNATAQKYKYNGKEYQDELNLNWYDYQARNYDPSIGKWMNIDPLAEMSKRFSPYTYALNNPVYFIDPDGMLAEDWHPNEKGNLVADIGDNAQTLAEHQGISIMEAEKQLYDNGVSSVSVGTEVNTGSINLDAVEVSSTSGDAVVGSNNMDFLDPSTVEQNILGLTYPGGNNPRTYAGDYDYTYVPSDLSEFPAIGHDRRYDNLGTEGFKGLVTDTRAIGADWKFVKEELTISLLSFNPKTKINAFILGVGLGFFALPKTEAALITPGGYDNIIQWYKISNVGVTNMPDKK